MMVNLKANPYFLDDEGITWVNDTLASMSKEEKIGQLFFAIGLSPNDDDILAMEKKYHFGGIMYRPGPASALKTRNEKLQKQARIPMLVAANLENGGNGALIEGTPFGSPLEISATQKKEYAYQLGNISSMEAGACGFNLSFAPVIDINRNWRNPITNTRTYGDDLDVIIENASEYIKGAHANNVAVTIKHFPGDGCDERDQHLVSSVNDLSCKQWDESYGKVYQNLIDKGAEVVMAGHILQPAYSKAINPDIKPSYGYPGSCSKELIDGLLRTKLGFNGLVMTDAANMMGYCVMPRKDLIPFTINAGVDMILFGKNLEEDIDYLRQAVEDGIVSMERIEEAVTRVLGTKAHLNLHKRNSFTNDDYQKILSDNNSKLMAKACADDAITLVKDSQHLLPIDPNRKKRVWLHVVGDKPGFTGGNSCKQWVVDGLERAGFDVDVYDYEHASIADTEWKVEDIKKKYDVIMYFSNVINASYQVVARIQWNGAVAMNAPYYCMDIPTLIVSLGNPYAFVDVPMIKTQINTYYASEYTVNATIDKIIGKSEFKGKSPVDPFNGFVGFDD